MKQFGEQGGNITLDVYQYVEALEVIKIQVSFYFLNNHKLFIHDVTCKCISNFTADYEIEKTTQARWN